MQNASDTAAPFISPSIRLGHLFWGVLLVLLLFVLIIKSFSMNPYAGDEYIYLYQAKLVGEGGVPYRDFAMAHPPVQALLTALVFKLFGTDFMVLRLLPIGWFLFGGVWLALLVRRELGDGASLFATFFYLLAHEPLRASSHFTGVNMTVTLLIMMVYFYRRDWIKIAAFTASLAVFTRLYAIPAVAILTIYAVLSRRQKGTKLIQFGALFGVGMTIVFGIWTGFDHMVHNLLLYHAQKTPMNPASLADMKLKVLFHNATLASLFFFSFLVLLFVLNRHFKPGAGFRKGMAQAVLSSRTGLVLLATGIAVGMLLVLIRMDRVWMYYFIPSFPFAAVGAGWMGDRLLSGLWAWIQSRRTGSAGPDRRAVVLGVLVSLLFGLAYIASPLLERQLIYFEKEMRKPPKQRVHTYSFPNSAAPDIVKRWVKANFWDPDRTIGHRYDTLNFYLWHESRELDIVEDVVHTIDEETGPDDEIFGDSGTVPMFALLSGRRIAGNEVDTNIQRYRSGNADPEALVSKIDNDKTKMIILRHRFGVYGVTEVRRLVKTKYRHLKRFRSSQGWVFDLFKRKTVKESAS